MKKIIYSLVLVYCMFSLTSCFDQGNYDQIEQNVVPQEFNKDLVFNRIYANLAVSGYDELEGDGQKWSATEKGLPFYSSIFLLNELPTDEAICAWDEYRYTSLNFMQVEYWNTRSKLLSSEFFDRLVYNIIYCDHFLTHVYNDGLNTEEIQRQIAEVQFLKALNLYYILDLYEAFPIALCEGWHSPFDYLIWTLESCQDNMYAPREAPYGRADRAAAWFLMAKLFLNGWQYSSSYSNDVCMERAVYYSEQIMNSGYYLAPEYKHLFMADNDGTSSNMARQEIIFPIRQNSTYIQGWGGSLFPIASTRIDGMPAWGTTEGWGGIRARKAMVNKFFNYRVWDENWGWYYIEQNIPHGTEEVVKAAANDDRALFYSVDRTLEINDVNDFKQGFSVTKWTNLRSTDTGNPEESVSSYYADTDIPFMRLGEVYLIYAEAKYHLGDHVRAVEVINILRNRANAEPLTWIDDFVILDERSRELFFEGHRRTDMNRFHVFEYPNEYNWDWRKGVKDGNPDHMQKAYPIPEDYDYYELISR